MRWLENFFLDHPRAAGMGYFQHLARASKIGGMMVFFGLLTLFHAIFPPFFPKAASKTITKLHRELASNHYWNYDFDLDDCNF